MHTSEFKPAWWLPNPHLQTLWSFALRRRSKITIERERFELPDGDFVDLDWLAKQGNGPIVILLHGLEGSIDSTYVGGMLEAIKENGWRGVLLHFRSCSGEMNRHPRMYHSGDTGDFAEVVAAIHKREPHTPLSAIGYSLGGNVLLKWLGETNDKHPLIAAAAISVPFELARTAERINCGFSRIYQRHFLQSLTKKIRQKFPSGSPWISSDLSKISTMRAFDELVTAPLHGFKNADDYYEKSSCRQFLTNIRIPTLLLHAQDDPFMTPETVPSPQELSPTVQLELTQHGGHIGFVAGTLPWRAEYWLEKRILAFLNANVSRRDL